VFASRLPIAEEYAGLLANEGIVRGLIGPREVPRLWDRHLMNSAVVAEQITRGASVADIGSGAGLPGLVLAVARPDLRVTLIEPLLRRSTFLIEAVASLGLDNVEVVRARAEDLHGERTFDVVTSRAVAPLDRLARWSLPLTRGGGTFLPMKGSTAATELTAAADLLRRSGASSWSIVSVGNDILTIPVTLIRVEKAWTGSGGR
jgi:16S rRNA (guanine527-N7)-methyltransferase